MDLTQLRYFQTIAHCGSLSAAARVLRVSQPTLTVSLRNLERGLGTTLFLRDRSGVRLTSTGHTLLRHTSAVMARIGEAEEAIRDLEGDEVGSFVIGCPESLGTYFLPAFLREFFERASRVDIELWNGTSRAVQTAVLAREVHFGLVVNPPAHPDLVMLELFRDAIDLFVRAEPDGKRARAWDLETARAIVRAGPLVYVGSKTQSRELLERLAADHLVPSRLLPCGNLELVKSLACEGVGVAVLPRRVAAHGSGHALVRLHPSLPFVPDQICLVYRADMHRTRAAMKLKDTLARFGRDLEARQGS